MYDNTYGMLTGGQDMPQDNFFIRHWKGEISPAASLVMTFIACWVPGPFIVTIIAGFCVGFYGGFSGQHIGDWVGNAISIPVCIVMMGWALVGSFRSCWNSRRWLSRIFGLVFCVLFSLVAVANIGMLFDQAHPPVVRSHR